MLRTDLSTRNIERMDMNERKRLAAEHKRLAASRRDRIGYVEAFWHTIAAFTVQGRIFEVAKLRDRRKPVLLLFDERKSVAHPLAYFQSQETAQEFIDLFRILAPYPAASSATLPPHFASEDPPHKPPLR